MYAKRGRPSIAPEKLLRALLLQVLYTIRSERQLMEQLDYNMLYRWFVGLNMDDPMWDVTVFTKNRERLLKGEIAQGFFEKVLEQARAQQLLSEEHFTVDGTLIEAWAGQKSFQRKDKTPPPEDGGSNPTVNFHGEKRRNQTHRSTTDPEAMLFRKSRGSESKLSYMGHVLMENRNGLVVDTRLTKSTGKAERESAWRWLARGPGRAAHNVGRRQELRHAGICGVATRDRRRRTWRRISMRGAPAPSMNAPPGTRATPSASENVSASRRSSAG